LARPPALTAAAAAAALLLGATVAARADCPVPGPRALPGATEAPARSGPPLDGVEFFANIQPSDGPLDAWCRLQAVLPKGKYDVKLIFFADKRGMMGSDYRAERTFQAAFDPANPSPRKDLANLIQSLVPTTPDGSATDANNQPFAAALERTVQGASPTTPDSQGLGIPPMYAQARSLALWVGLQLKVRPVRLFNRDFYVSVTFLPSVGQLLLATGGRADQFILRAATKRVMPYRAFSNCPEFIPDCKGYDKPTVDLQTAWLVQSVGLASEGDGGLSAVTESLAKGMIQKALAQAQQPRGPADPGAPQVALNSMNGFSATDGSANVQIRDDTKEVELKAKGDPDRASGTKLLQILWQERVGAEQSYASRLAAETKKTRDRMVINQNPLR